MMTPFSLFRTHQVSEKYVYIHIHTYLGGVSGLGLEEPAHDMKC